MVYIELHVERAPPVTTPAPERTFDFSKAGNLDEVA